MVISGTVLITYLLGSHLKRDIKNIHLVTSRKWITDTEWLVKLQSTDRNNSLKLCLSELFHSQFLRYRGSKNNKNLIKKEEKGKHFFSGLNPLSNALQRKRFRVKMKCVFFSQRRMLTRFMCFLFIKCSILYISGWQTDFPVLHTYQIGEHSSLSWQIGFYSDKLDFRACRVHVIKTANRMGILQASNVLVLFRNEKCCQCFGKITSDYRQHEGSFCFDKIIPACRMYSHYALPAAFLLFCVATVRNRGICCFS